MQSCASPFPDPGHAARSRSVGPSGGVAVVEGAGAFKVMMAGDRPWAVKVTWQSNASKPETLIPEGVFGFEESWVIS